MGPALRGAAAAALGALALGLAAREGASVAPALRFEEVAGRAGLNVRHHTRAFSGPYADALGMFTSGGAAVAVGDFDGDGLDDLFVTDSGAGRPNHLFRNLGHFAFADVTEKAGVSGGNDARAIVSDALWFDYDNDGRRDLLVARFGTPLLYHNEGGGRFTDVSGRSGLDRFANTIAVIAFDYDRDGRLDLLFGNYFRAVDLFDPAARHVLPNDLDNAVNGGGVTLWRNQGDGRFVDVTAAAGLGGHTGWTTDVGHGDFDGDGFEDVYLACDYGTDRLFINNGDGTFRDVTARAIGLDTKKGMNAEVGDFDGDGRLDVYVTNITDEYMRECNMLWRNNGDGTFTDVARETGTCETLWGWAAKFGDFDNDGWLDLFAVDGLRSAGPASYLPAVVDMIVTPGIDFTDLASWPPIGDRTWSGYQRKKLFRNLGGQAFAEVAAAAGVANDFDGRGIGLGDFDDDGRIDIVQTSANQPLLVYRNVTEPSGHWVELRLAGTRSNRDAIGARVALKTKTRTLVREVDGGNGYAGQGSTRLHFGLGTETAVESVVIRWPSGLEQTVSVRADRITSVREGSPPGP